MPPQQTDVVPPSVPVEPVPSAPPPPMPPVQPEVVQPPAAMQPPVAPVVETPPPVFIPPQPVLQEIPQPVIQPEAQAPEQYAPAAAKIMFEGETQTQQIKSTGMMQWVIANSGGTIKDEKQAVYTLIGFSVAIALFSLYLIFSTSVTLKAPAPEMDPLYVPPTMNGAANRYESTGL